jgi:hypothetical protein
MRTTVFIAALFVALLAVIGLRKKPAREPVVDQPAAETMKPQDVMPAFQTRRASAVIEPTAVAVIQPMAEVEQEYDPAQDGAVKIEDPETHAAAYAFKQRRELRWFETSPIRDTSEAKAIEALLVKHGVSNRAAVGPCYRIAFNYQHALRVMKDPKAAMAMIEPEKGILQANGHKVMHDDFWRELFTIKPTVFDQRPR